MIIIGGLLTATAVTAGVWYYLTPKYSRVGYQPIQPVAFSHAMHVDQLGFDCRYCHNGVEKSWYSNIPASSTCMNCHSQVLKDDPRLALVRESAETGQPIPWVQIHRVPDFVYFNHSVHVNRGISCVECHGQINQMDEVYQVQPLSMTFCLDCHRNPAAKLRPLDKITDLNWKWSDNPTRQRRAATQERPEADAGLARAVAAKLLRLPPMKATTLHVACQSAVPPAARRGAALLAEPGRAGGHAGVPAVGGERVSRGRHGADRPGHAAALHEDHVRLVPAGGRRADGLPPAGVEHSSLQQAAGGLPARRAAVLRDGHADARRGHLAGGQIE